MLDSSKSRSTSLFTYPLSTQLSTGSDARLAGRVRRRPERAGKPIRSSERLEAMDTELARRARDAGRLRFELGRGLDLLERSGGDHALGFSSIEAYALERCERRASWVQKARGLARRLDKVPVLAEALISGSINWSMATVLASVAREEDADFWLAEAAWRTVREMKALVLERRRAERSGSAVAQTVDENADGLRHLVGQTVADDAGGLQHLVGQTVAKNADGPQHLVGQSLDEDAGELQHLEAEEEMRTLTLNVPREDAWCFEQARLLARHVADGAGGSDAEVMFGLVAEATSTLCGELPRNAITLMDDEGTNAQRAWEQQLARMRAESEARCEANFRRARERQQACKAESVLESSDPKPLEWPASPESIDRQLREVAHGLVMHEVVYGRALEAFFAADGWRRLGYASAAQYARERLGTSLSSIKDKRQLARRLGQLRFLADAVERGELGYEAARLVAGVATLQTEEAWVARAKERTLRHLRQEINVAELKARWPENPAVLESSDTDVHRVEELAVVAGQMSAPPLQLSDADVRRAELQARWTESPAVVPPSDADVRRVELKARWPENPAVVPPSDADVRHVEELERAVVAGQMSAPPPQPVSSPSAKVTIRVRVRASTARDFRHWEAIYLRYRKPALRHTTFLRFACEVFTSTWRPRPEDVAYARIYARDRHRCQSPCCGRRDITPHHLRFRSHGGDDSDENVTSLCTWCHLEGIHGGQMSAAPPASHIRWTFGRNEHTIVEGRRRIRT